MEFYSSIAELYDYIFPLNQDQLDFTERELRSRDSASGVAAPRVLDLGCGTGNLSIALAGRAYRVTGIDFDGGMISRAAEKAGGEEKEREVLPGVSVNFMQMDMLKIDKKFSPGSFDAVLCFGNTLVHLTEPDKIAGFLKAVSRVLVPGGVFLLQIINYDRILDQSVAKLSTIENEHIRFERNYGLEPESGLILFHTQLTAKKTGEVIDNTILLYPLRAGRLREFLEEAGFAGIKLYGDFSGAPLTAESVPLIASASLSRTRLT